MNKKNWFIPVLIVVLNALAIIIRWSSLPELLPAHFDLEGNAGGTMPRNALLYQPMIGAAVCLSAYIYARIKNRLQTGLVILSSGICMVLLLSTLVTLTMGRMPVFMLAEPVVLLAAVAAGIISMVKSCKKAG